MRLIIVRHGETDANVNGVLQGHQDNPLNHRGRIQAKRVAHRLADEPMDALYSSDLLRAIETARAISSAVGVDLETSHELRERSYGEFEGRPVHEYRSALAASGLQREEFVPLGGESVVQVEARVSKFLSDLREQFAMKTVTLVAHSGTNRALLKILLNKQYSDWLSIEQDNACVNIFEISRDGVKPVTVNCTAHLAPNDKHQ
ncbi:MAG: histidine phosphatase family protein [Bdellovibrionota bacterium]